LFARYAVKDVAQIVAIREEENERYVRSFPVTSEKAVFEYPCGFLKATVSVSTGMWQPALGNVIKIVSGTGEALNRPAEKEEIVCACFLSFVSAVRVNVAPSLRDPLFV